MKPVEHLTAATAKQVKHPFCGHGQIHRADQGYLQTNPSVPQELSEVQWLWACI